MKNSEKSIYDAFQEFFEIVHANTDELKKEVFKLRFQVYCLEIGGYDPDEFPENMESDEYDDHSSHYLVKHRKSGEYAATTRLIIPNPTDSSALFPLEKHCTIDKPEIVSAIDREHLAEVSRFCVSKEFKRRKNEAQTLAAIGPSWNVEEFSSDEKRTFPHIALALFACLIRASHENDILFWCASMEPSFLRFIGAFGVKPTPIGPLADYHGDRSPCIINVNNLLHDVAEKNLDVWNMFTDNGRYAPKG